MRAGSSPGAGRHAQRLAGSERARLDPFVVATGDASPRDQRDLMERPFFSLANPKVTPPRVVSGPTLLTAFASAPSAAGP